MFQKGIRKKRRGGAASGWALVYRAHDERLHRIVALKLDEIWVIEPRR
jgi:hypothetical protein